MPTEKDAYYFPHFSNARNDRKIKRIIKDFGVEGYGMFFMLLEVLRDQTDFRFPMKDIDLLADEFNVSEAKLRTVVSKYDLFNIDPDQMFFSPKLIVYLTPYLEMKEQRRIAGRKSAEKRKNQKLLGENSTTVQLPFNNRSTVAQQSKVKESKGEESKGEKINESIQSIIQMLFIRTFGRNPLLPEYSETEQLIKEYGFERVESAFHLSVIQCVKKLSYVKGILKNENIKIEQAKPENLTTTQKMILQMKAENGH